MGPPRPSHVSEPAAAPAATPSPSASGTSTPRTHGIPTRLAIDNKAHDVEENAAMNAANMTEEEKRLREKEKKKGLSKEQREELAAFEAERRKQREKRVNYISVWTETDKSKDVTTAFKEKTRLEIEN